MKIKELLRKNRELILYVIIGGLTTLVNIGAYWVFAHPVSLNHNLSNIIAWVISVAFAFITNKVWVFESRSFAMRVIWGEIAKFFVSRLLSGLLDFGIMYLFVDIFTFNDMWVKIISNVIVIVLNYILSKFIVFKGKEK